MKFLHTADWHLGKKLNGHSRHPEQVEVLDEICRIAEEKAVDLILVAGDLFDNSNPSIESTELFYKTLRRLSADGSRAVIAIAGNHDSPERIAAQIHWQGHVVLCWLVFRIPKSRIFRPKKEFGFFNPSLVLWSFHCPA